MAGIRNWKIYSAGISLIAVCLAIAGCSLPDEGNSDFTPALKLRADDNLSLTQLSWDPVKVTGFKEYILLQSTGDIPDEVSPPVGGQITILKRINEIDQTSFSAAPVLFTGQVCYKLYCAVDDRFLYSPTICREQNVKFISGFYDRGCHEAGNDEMVLFDRINDNLSIYNYKTDVITHSVKDIVLNFPSMQMSTWAGSTQVFGFDQSPAWMRKYTYPSLSATNSRNYNFILWAANVHEQFVFAAVEEPNKGFQVLSRNNFTGLDSRPGMSGNQNIAVFPGNPLTVVVLGTSGTIRYTIDGNGKIMSEQILPTVFFQPDQQFACAQGSQLFIAGQRGTIINAQGQLVTSLASSNNSFIFLTRLSPDEKKAAFVISEAGNNRLEIADLSSLPSIPERKSHNLPSLNYTDIIIEQDVVYVIGAAFNSSQPQTFILKYPL